MTLDQARYLYNLFADPDYIVKYISGMRRYDPRMVMGESSLPLVYNGVTSQSVSYDLLTDYTLQHFEVYRNITSEVLAGAPST